MAKTIHRVDAAAPVFVAWRENYSVGHAELDEQHRRVLQLVNDLYAAIQNGTAERLVRPMLDELTQLLPTQWAREELLMEQTHFPGRENHRALRRRLAMELQRLQERLFLPPRTNSDDLFSFLKSLWTSQVRDAEQQRASFVRTDAQHAAPSAAPAAAAAASRRVDGTARSAS